MNEIRKELFEISWNIELTEPEYDPSLGAAMLALEKTGIGVDENFLDKVIDNRSKLNRYFLKSYLIQSLILKLDRKVLDMLCLLVMQY